MFRKILVGTDGSDSAAVAVAHAVHLAARLQAELVIATAYEREAKSRGDPIGGGRMASGLDVAKALLRDARAGTGTEGRISTRAVDGPPADALVRLAEEGFDLLVVGNRGMRGAGGRFWPRSVPDEISHRAPTHLLVVQTGSDAPPRFERVLAATDGSATADRAVALAASLAASVDASLTLVNVSASEAEGRALLEGYASRFPGSDTRVLSGRPAESIARFAAKEGHDVVVVGNRGMTGPRRFLGSVPDRLSHMAGLTLLIAKTT